MADVIVKDAEGQPQTYRGIKRVILQTDGGEATFFDEIEAGEGVVIEGSMIKVDPSKVPVAERDSWYAGLVPRTSDVVDGVPVWSYYFTSPDAVPYAGVMRDGNGGIAGVASQLYQHTGSVTIDGTSYGYCVLNTRSTAFTSVEDGFGTGNRNSFILVSSYANILVRLSPKSGGGYWYSKLATPGTSNSASTAILSADYVTAL